MEDQALADRIGSTARQQLTTLRRALDERLSELEAALSGSRHDVSLETLILDLARVATDEAAAATELACAEAKAEADAALGRLSSLEHTRETERRQLEERYEAALGLERARVRDLERAVQETRQELDALRSGSAQSSEARARAEERVSALSRTNAESVAKCEKLEGELARARASAAEHERAHRELQQRVEVWQAEQAAQKAEKEEMKQVLASVQGVFMKFGQQKMAIDERFRTLQAELERTRAALAERKPRTRA